MRKQKYGEYHLCTCPQSRDTQDRSFARPSLFPPLLTRCGRSCAPVFTNILKDSFLHELADADDGEIIKQVQVRIHSRPDCAKCRHTVLGKRCATAIAE